MTLRTLSVAVNCTISCLMSRPRYRLEYIGTYTVRRTTSFAGTFVTAFSRSAGAARAGFVYPLVAVRENGEQSEKSYEANHDEPHVDLPPLTPAVKVSGHGEPPECRSREHIPGPTDLRTSR
jgi:hypothetical protein